MRSSVLVLLFLGSCATSPMDDPQLEPGPMFSVGLLPESDTPHTPRIGGVPVVPGGSRPFTLRSDRVVNGRTFPAGTVLHGLCIGDHWIREPQFDDAIFWHPGFAMVKHVDDDHWWRLDLKSGTEERMPFRALVTVRRYASNNLDHGRVVGLGPDPSDPTLCTVWLLDGQWRIAAELPRVVAAETRTVDRVCHFRREQSLDLMETAYVAHHRDARGIAVDVVYDLAGKPLSPALEPLRRLEQEGHTGQFLFGVRTDPQSDLYWPLHRDGTITPKPAHIAGIKVLQHGSQGLDRQTPFVGGVVMGTVDGEERFAYIAAWQWHGQSAIDALAKSDFRALELVGYTWHDLGDYDRNTGYSGGGLRSRFGLLVQRTNDDAWHLQNVDGNSIVGAGYPTREDALRALAQRDKANEASYLLESERQRKEFAYAMSWRERRDAEAAAHAAAVKKALQEIQAKYRGTDATAGLALARTLRDNSFAGAEAFARFVAQIAEKMDSKVPLADLELARTISTDPALQDRLLSALQTLHPEKYPRQVAAASGHGGSAGAASSSSSSTASSPPVWTGPSVAETMSNARWASQYSYLSGQTNAYWGSSGVLRR
ncbi:MAG: hypothetical protein JNK15_17805 [Planctomycetes bacterium]|nr:hypothetical protein [Planctomycetota bacterium]